MDITRRPECDDGTAVLGSWNKPGDDYLLLADGQPIGGSYWCGADYINNGERWASWGPAGLSMGHRTREAAEAVQVTAYEADPAKFDQLIAASALEVATERAARDATRETLLAERRAAALPAPEEPGRTIFTVPAYHLFYADRTEVNAVHGWLMANGLGNVSADHEIRVEKRTARTVIAYEAPARNGDTDSQVVTMTVAPPAITPTVRPDLHELFIEHAQALFPLADHQTAACGACTQKAGALVPWPCPTVTAAIEARAAA